MVAGYGARTVHQDLISHNKLPNPFYGMNEQKVQWVENEDWVYKTTFNVTDEQLSRDAALLILEGLDTYADIYLNGSLLERTDNMFVGYTLPVKEVLRKGENHLQILFHSPVKQTLPQWETNGFDYPADNDHSDKRVSIYSRKAPYSYGWDWGIRLVTSGIWRPVTLTFYDVARIDDYYVRQASVTKDLAKVENRLTVNSVSATPQKAEVTVAYSYKEGEKVTEQKEVTLQPGTNHILLPIEIRQPHLWMPNGWGEPALYDFEAEEKYRDMPKAIEYYKMAVEHGHYGAMNNLGVCYKEGDGVELDFDEAFRLFERAARGGDEHAYLNLARAYTYGQGTDIDLKAARQNYLKAARQGYSRAQFWLGYFYENHPEIKNAPYRCSYWYRQASKQNDVQAIVALGYCYESGFGVKQKFNQSN